MTLYSRRRRCNVLYFLPFIFNYCSAWIFPKFTTRSTTLLWETSESDNKHQSINTPLSRVDQLRSLQRSSSSASIEDHVLDAAAAVTQQSCELLGVKSVGVDYGLVRTGLAATVGYEPKPIGIVSHLNNTQVCQQVIRYCRLEQASQIVVGLPLHKNGTEAEQTNLTRIFAQQLAAVALQELGPDVPVYMWDERYTSKFAAARAHSQNPDRYLYGTLDADAACIILEHFYQNNGKGAHPVELEEDVKRACLEVWELRKEEAEEAHRKATEQRLGGKSSQRQEAMERARKLEEELEKQGALGVSRKKKKQTKKKREKRGPWLAVTPDQKQNPIQ
jgi:putative holliday junction resolvase